MVNVEQILCIHVCKNGKMIPVETVPGVGGGEVQKNDGRSEYT
jgi:hypothetical protein